MVALADLALSEGDGQVSLLEIAERQGISVAYLEQLFVKLKRAGLVESTRGPHGGYRLARKPDEIKISAILDAVDERIDVHSSGLGMTGGRSGTREQSLSNRLWEGLAAQVYVFLHQICLSDVVDNKLAPCPAVPSILSIVDE